MTLPLPGDPETSYIQACLGSRLFPERPQTATPAGLDWEKLLALLKRNHLASFFYSLRPSGGPAWPEEFSRQILGNRHLMSLYGDQCAGRVRAVLTALHGSGIDVIVLKGWAYIQTIYAGDHSARYCEDMDILVSPQQTVLAAAVLTRLGYRSKPETWPGFRLRFHNSQPYTLRGQPKIFNQLFPVGLHWGLLHTPYYNPAQVDMVALFQRARPLSVEGVQVLELSSEDQIVYGCAHLGLHHAYSEDLHYYYEIAALIQRLGLELDWAALSQRASTWHCIIPVQRVLLELERLWPGLLPAAALEQVKALPPVFLERFVNCWIGKTAGRPSFEHLLIWITTPGLLRRMELVFKLVFPSPSYLKERFGAPPAGFWPILYFRWLFRSFRLLGKKPQKNP
jgi:hypothetical protein